MDTDLSLNSPVDRRLIKEINDTPPGPPGAKNDVSNSDQKTIRLSGHQPDSDRRRTPSKSPRRKSLTRSGRSSLTRSRRSPSPYRRRNRRSRSRNHSPMRGRNYSPERRRFSGGGRARGRRFSPDRRRDHSRERDRDRRHDDRFRGRSGSCSPQRRWSPLKKPSSPPAPPPPPQNVSTQYSVPAQIFTDNYGYQYSSSAFPPATDYITAPPPPPFPNTFPMAPPTWGISSMPEEYDVHQQSWPSQSLSIPSICQTQEIDLIQAAPPLIVHPEVVPDLYKKKAVEKEAQNQREEFRKQRNGYLEKANKLKDNIKALKEQRKDLKKVQTPLTPHTKAILDENERLQNQMQKKLITIDNVIDMLSGIIGDENLQPFRGAAEISEIANSRENTSPKSTSSSRSSSTSSISSKSSDGESVSEKLKKQVIESMRSKREERETTKEDKKTEVGQRLNEGTGESKKLNYDFYDPEIYWCQKCNVFPQNAKLYLVHLHSKEHLNNTYETPWRDKLCNGDNASFLKGQTNPYPIRGLQFFVPSKSWYCKLCNFWVGDMHCASFHLKSNTHCSNYLKFINENPNFESDWIAERQKAFDLQSNESPPPPPPPQITSILPTKKDVLEGIPLQIGKKYQLKNISDSEKLEEKGSVKKSTKTSDDKKDKKKKKRSKKRKKLPRSSSSSNSDSSYESNSDSDKATERNSNELQDQAVSVRVSMRNLTKEEVTQEAETGKDISNMQVSSVTKFLDKSCGEVKWTTNKNVTTDNCSNDNIELQTKKDDLLISPWSDVRPVVTENEIKMIENLKKNVNVKIKTPVTHSKLDVFSNNLNYDNNLPSKQKKENIKSNPSVDKDKNIRSRSKSKRVMRRNDSDQQSSNRDRDRVRERSRSRGRRSKSRGRQSRSHDRHSRSRDRRRSKSRGRFKKSRSRGNRRSRGRFSPSYGRRRRRSQSNERRRRSTSRSRSKSIEKPIVRHSEFRPRIPENKKGIKTKFVDENDPKKSPSKKVGSTTVSTSTAGKKLPFIGRMPVFKKQTQNNETDKKDDKIDDSTPILNQNETISNSLSSFPVTSLTIRQSLDLQQRETLYESQFDPNMMVDYDDLMPDPVQFISLMGAPPPPPSSIPPLLATQYTDDVEMLPPGIDEGDAECVPKPISDAPIPRKGPLPKDFEEALNIIFPGEKPLEVEKKTSGETTVIIDRPVMHPQDLAKEGIRIMSVEETTEAAMDKTSQLSMNEPLVFNTSSNVVQLSSHKNGRDADLTSNSHMECLPGFDSNTLDEQKASSPTPSEKLRRKEELDDLAMLGIDADDLAAQCI